MEVVAWCQRCGVQEDEPRDAQELTGQKRVLNSLPFASIRVHSWFLNLCACTRPEEVDRRREPREAPIRSKKWFANLKATANARAENQQSMGKERFTERQSAVLNAAARLDEIAALPETDIVRDAAIQRFEFTFELVWKALQLYLEREGFESGSPRAVLKRAFIIGMISDRDEADIWLQMLDDRNLTSHAYDEALAVRIYTRIVQDYAPRLAWMAQKIQTLAWD